MSAQTPLLPIFVKLESHRCLVVGAGAVALQKITNLIECGARITVVAPEAISEVERLATVGQLALYRRAYRREDLDHISLVIAATSDPAVNHAVYSDATELNVLVNAVDDPPCCDFYFSSVVRRGPLQIAISTTGESPALAQRLRQQLQAALPEDTGSWLSHLGRLRRAVIEDQPAGPLRNNLLKNLASRDVCKSESCPSRQMAREPKVKAESWWLT